MGSPQILLDQESPIGPRWVLGALPPCEETRKYLYAHQIDYEGLLMRKE
jgi:hypothetical protein